jgi:hypothetical protein
MPSPKPAVIIRREFEATPEVVTQQLRACIIGQACQLVRFANASEKANGFIQAILSPSSDSINDNQSAKTLFANEAARKKNFPNSLASDSVLDADSVKLFMEDAFLTYADVGQADFRPDNTSASYNSVVLSSGGWRQTTGVNRIAGLSQDVQIGDTVQLYTVDAGVASLIRTTKVSGFSAELGNASLGSAFATVQGDYIPANPGKLDVDGVSFNIDVSQAYNSAAKLNLADHRKVGYRFAKYTIRVVDVNIDKDNNVVADIAVTTNTGLDSSLNKIDSIVLGDSTSFVQLPSGIKITAEAAVGKDPGSGGSVSFDYGARHEAYSYSPAGGQEKISILLGPGANAIQNTSIYTVRCIEGGAVNTAAGAKFEWFIQGNTGSAGTFTVNNMIPNESNTINLNNGISVVFGAIASSNPLHSGFVANDTLSFTINPAAAGAVRTMILADRYSSNFPVQRVRLSKVKTVEIPAFQPITTNRNWVLTNPDDSEIRAIQFNSSNVLISDSSVVGTAYVTAGKLYAQYRSVLALPRDVGSVNTLADITSQLGTIDAANPLAYAVFKAFTNANGATVHYIPIVSDSLNGHRGYADAISLAKGNRNCYSLVPLSASSEVWNAFVAHVLDESAPEAGRYRILWIAPEINRHFKIQDSAVGDSSTRLMANITAITGEDGRYQIVSLPNIDSKFTETTKVGDWVRVTYGNDAFGNATFKEYKIVSVIDNTTLKVSSSTVITPGDYKIEIYRDLTSAEMADKYVQIAGQYSSERVFAVVPNRGVDGFRVDGKPVKNYHIAAAFAGLRSGSRPHQPLSNVELVGFDGINATVPAFNETDLDTLRDGGIWVVVTNDEGKTYVERQLSTSTFDIFRKEQSVTCNIDSMSFSIGDGLKNLVGRVNITDGNLSLVRASLVSILTSFMNATGSETIGAQLASYTIDQIFVPSTANDTIKAKISISVPLPMNIIDITIVV